MKRKKIVPGVVSGLLVAVISWASAQFAGVVIPAEVAASITGLLAIGVSLITPDAMEVGE